MRNFSKFAGYAAISVCSFTSILLAFRNTRFPFEIWGLHESVAAKWTFLLFSAFMISGLVTLCWAGILDWLKRRPTDKPRFFARLWKSLTTENKYAILKDTIRSLKFFLNATICAAIPLLTLVFLLDMVPLKWVATATKVILFLSAFWMSSFLFLRQSHCSLLDLRKDREFINSEEAQILIIGSYMSANKFCKILLKKIFPSQLYRA